MTGGPEGRRGSGYPPRSRPALPAGVSLVPRYRPGPASRQLPPPHPHSVQFGAHPGEAGPCRALAVRVGAVLVFLKFPWLPV